MVKTFRFRVKDKHAADLARKARAVNFVWNFCNETQRRAIARGSRWPSRFDLINLTAGCGKDLGVGSDTIGSVCAAYVTSRSTSHRRWLRWRGRRALGWIPFRFSVPLRGCSFRHYGTDYSVWLSRIPPSDTISGDFSQDSRGRWYVNVQCESEEAPPREPTRTVGIDLGLKDLATLSTGEKIEAPRLFRQSENKLAAAQRAGKKRLARTVHARIAGQRADFLHKLSARLVRDFDVIAVGNLSVRRLARTSMAKSVNDAGWSALRRMLSYKAIAQGATYRDVSENGSTQVCSDCDAVGGPKGRENLVVRQWTCQRCGVEHDRDHNAAKNIARWGHPAPTGALAL